MRFSYQVGGTLPPTAPTYVERQADRMLLEQLQRGNFCYVLTSRQMGKSSLRVRAMERLRALGHDCIDIDLTLIGTQQVTPEDWYAGLVSCIATALPLATDESDWWFAHQTVPPLQRLGQFIATVVLPATECPIVIFIDEIDAMLHLENKDDFFAWIRACYNQRATIAAYQRLTFCLLGVAQPQDLISDVRRTPFNIGQGITLTGFTATEAHPLTKGLTAIATNPTTVLQRILHWTGGQPFLTQRLCGLLQQQATMHPNALITATEVDQLIQTQILHNWDSNDEQEHFQTIQRRILNDPRQASSLLGLYQQVLTTGSIPDPRSPSSLTLCLSGLVVSHGGQLTLANRIYGAIFDYPWTVQALAEVCPYGAAMASWVTSGQDSSWLLRGERLAAALAWAGDRTLSTQDYQFLTASQLLDRQVVESELLSSRQDAVIIAQSLVGQVANPLAVLKAILGWTHGEPSLTQRLCQQVLWVPESVRVGQEQADIAALVQNQLINTWDDPNNGLTATVRQVRDRLLTPACLADYQRFLNDRTVTPALHDIGLVTPDGAIANPIYAAIFTDTWLQTAQATVQADAIARQRQQSRQAIVWAILSSLFLAVGAIVILAWSNWTDFPEPPLLLPTVPQPENPIILASVLLSLIVIYLVSKLGGEFCKWLGFPPVLGELLGGVAVGVSGVHFLMFANHGGTHSSSTLMQFFKITTDLDRTTLDTVFQAQSQVITTLADLGVIILLFEIGLQSNLTALLNVGGKSLRVAIVGVILPFVVGSLGLHLGFHIALIPSLFAGAALTATSIGITSRVLADLNHLNTSEGQIILGAAVIDDILAIIILAVVTSLAKTGHVELINIGYFLIGAAAFLGGAILIGRGFNQVLIQLADRLSTRGQLLIPTLTFALILSYGANVLDLEPLLGAFTAGLVFQETDQGQRLQAQIAPIADLLIPVFFVTVGAKTNFWVLFPGEFGGQPQLWIAGFLVGVAVLGKVAAGGALWGEPQLNRWAIGIGMMPRGEVGLVFVGVGSAAQVLPDFLAAAIVLMVIVTTFLMPLWLRVIWHKSSDAGDTAGVL